MSKLKKNSELKIPELKTVRIEMNVRTANVRTEIVKT